MSIKDKQTINVLNYNNNKVSVSARDTSYIIPASEDGNPGKVPFSFAEIETMNSNGNAFTSGMLRFEEHEEADAYEALRITAWKDILSNDEIENIILEPSYEGLKKIVDIRNSSVFERIRGIYTRLKNDESNDISNRIERIINTRYKELLSSSEKTKIVLTPKDTAPLIQVDADAIREENAALKTQMDELKAMMSTLIKPHTDVVSEAKPESTSAVKKAAKK